MFRTSTGALLVRVVFDGPPLAGKTETLRMLARSLRTDIVSHESVTGRTSWFDWVEYDGGVFAGRPIRFHIISVPGQRELAGHRRDLLRLADVVVYVCDSTHGGLAAGGRALTDLRADLDAVGATPHLVVQANKQDHPDAASLDHVRHVLGLDAGEPLVATSALTGANIRNLLVESVRPTITRARASSTSAFEEVEAHGHDELLDRLVADHPTTADRFATMAGPVRGSGWAPPTI